MTRLKTRITITSTALGGILALAAAFVGGVPAVLGIAAGGALALGDFWWLAARLGAVLSPEAVWGGSGWLLATGLRFVALAVGAAVVLATGVVDPVALVLGFTVLPVVLVAQGLRAAREGA
jgi:hypothetical protein